MMIPFVLTLVLVQQAEENTSSQSVPPDSQQVRIEWLTDLPEASLTSHRTRKPLVVAFFAAWCPSCRRFQSRILPTPAVQGLAERFLWVQVDIDRHVSFARSYAVEATPRFDLIDPDGVTRTRIIGVLPPREFQQRLESFLADVSKNPHPLNPSTPSRVEGLDRTPLTWSADGYRGLSICFSNVGYGPLSLTSQSPFQSLRSSFLPRTPSTLAENHFEVRQTETWVNVFAQSAGKYLLDFEMLRSSVAVAYGITDTVEVEAEFVNKSRFGGAMDSFIQGFHRTFGLDQGGRDTVPKNDFAFDVAPQGGNSGVSLSNQARGDFSQELLATLQYNVTCGAAEMPALAAAVTVRGDLGNSDELRGGLPVSLAMSLSASKRVGEFYGYLGVGMAWFGHQDFLGIELRPTQLSALAAVEWRFAAEMSLVLQYLVSQGVARALGPFSAPSHEITLGFKGEITRGAVLELGLIENVITFDNSPDFGLHLGLTLRF